MGGDAEMKNETRYVVLKDFERRECARTVIEKRVALVVNDERRVREADIDALRSVLEEPATLRVALVVAADELAKGRVADLLALDQPIPAAIERQPAEHGGNVRPFGEAAGDDLVHGARIFAEEGLKAKKLAQRQEEES